MVLRFDPGRLLTPVIFFLALIGISYWLNPEPWHHISRGTEALFAAALLTLAGLAVAMRQRSYVKVDDLGLEIQYLTGAPRRYAWADIDAASVAKRRVLLVPVISTVRLKLRDGVRSTHAVRRGASSIMGYDVSFLAVYEESAEEIVERIKGFLRGR